MTISKKELDRVKEENRHAEKVKLIDSIARLGGKLIQFGAFVLCMRYIFLAIKALSGQETIINIFYGFFTNADIKLILSVTIPIGGVLYGLYQRRLKNRTIKHLQERKKQLELKIDPNRTTSNLTARGETNPEDRL